MTATWMSTAWLPFVETVLKVTLLLALAGLASLALRRSSAALRHLVWTLALSGALVVPGLTLVLPKWEVPLFRAAAPVATVHADRQPAPRALRFPGAHRAAPPQADAAGRVADSLEGVSEGPGVRSAASWLVMAWLVGAAVLVAKALVGTAAAAWMTRRTPSASGAPWLPLARDLARALHITPRLRFRRSGRARMPLATGIVRPSIVMPADADTWPVTRLRVVLLHELAHVKRRDCLTHALAQIACALHWFNPLVWVAVRHLRIERERACDDLALSAGMRGSDYAGELLEMARSMRGGTYPAVLSGAALGMAHRSQLEGRLIALLDPKVARASLSARTALAAAALFGAAVTPLAAVQPWTAPAGPPAAAALMAPGVVVEPSWLPPPPAPRQAEKPHQVAAVPADAAEPVTLASTPTEVLAPLPPLAVPVVHGALAAAGALAGVNIGVLVTDAISGAVQEPAPKPQPAPGPAPDPAKRRPADPRTVAALIEAMKDADAEVREAAVHALVQLHDPAAFEPLVRALQDSSASVREYAAFALGQLDERRAVGPLTAALKDASADVREQAVFALGQLGDAATVEPLALALRDASLSVREQAAFALGQIRDRRAVEPLISALKDSSTGVRSQAAFALGQHAAPEAVDALIVAARDASAEVREHVIFALAQLRDPRAIDVLTEALKDASPKVRQQAAFALGQLAR